MWQDGSRRRMRFVKNEYGSSHPEATLLEGVEGKQTGVIQGVKKSKRMIMIPLKAATPLKVLHSLTLFSSIHSNPQTLGFYPQNNRPRTSTTASTSEKYCLVSCLHLNVVPHN